MKRAITNEQKREILDRIYKLWIDNPELRLGQLIFQKALLNIDTDLFYLEDYDLIKEMEMKQE